LRHTLDEQVAAGLERFAASSAPAPAPARGDWRALREVVSADMARLAASEAVTRPQVATADFTTQSAEGTPLALRWYQRRGTVPGSAVVFAHGGGMIAGDVDSYDGMVSGYVARTGVPFLSVEYRLAPEASETTPAREVISAVAWLRDRASSLGVQRERIAVMGESAGAGIAAAAAIGLRDVGVELAAQILIYPMLDDRNTGRSPIPDELLTWTAGANYTGWHALLGERVGGDRVSPLAAPARLGNFAGLPRAYVEVGELDLFCEESIRYAGRLAVAGVPLELHVHPRAPHGFDRFAPDSHLARRALADRGRVLQSL
jgi:acetyl esterase/lipase